ncbi:MAG: DUF4173 domain-containing protein [Actinomycetota bacterium]
MSEPIEPTTAEQETDTSTAPSSPAPPPPPPPPFVPVGHQRAVELPPREPTVIEPAWIVAALVAGLVADIALRRVPWNNVAGATLIVTLAGGLFFSGYIRTTTARMLLFGSVFFGIFLAIRTEPRLTTINVIAAMGLLVLGAVHGQGRPFWDLRPLRLLTDGGLVFMEAVIGLVEVPAEVSARIRVIRERAESTGNGTPIAILRGLAIAVPLVLVLGLLLASADAVFQSFFTGFGNLDLGIALGHVILFGVGAYGLMVLLRLAHTQGGTDPIQRALSLGHIEVGVVLGAVNVLFAAFAVAQLLTVVGGAEDALERAGVDPKQFARQGFFQLLWVAAITLVLLMILRAATAENSTARSVNRVLSLLTVALTMVIVTVAFTRIGFYIDDNGMTPLRLYSAIFTLWVGMAFVVTAVRIWGIRSRQAWLLPVLLLSGLGTLAVINVANPERVIAMDNVARDHDPLYWHVLEGQFSGDGQAVLAEEIDRLNPDLAVQVTEALCDDYQRSQYRSGWLDFNLGKWRAEQAVPELCDG